MSHKIEKINELLRQEIGQILLREEEFGQGVLTTILEVDTSPDLRQATVVFSVWPDAKGQSVMKKLTAHIWHLQQLLNKRLQIHPVPKIRFALNSDEATSQSIETLIEKVKQTDIND